MANPNPKPPKRKKRSSYSLKVSGANQKRSNYDYATARKELGSLNADAQQVMSAALQTGENPRATKGKIPVKQVVKAQLTHERNRNAKLKEGKEWLEMKVDSLKQQVRDFADALKAEKHKSWLAMAKILDDEERMMADSIDDRAEINTKKSAAELAVEKERQRAHDAVHNEHQYTALKINACKSSILFVYLQSTINIMSVILSETKASEGFAKNAVRLQRCGRACKKQHATQIEQRSRFEKLRKDVSNEKDKWMSK
jgi:hypothetical protein